MRLAPPKRLGKKLFFLFWSVPVNFRSDMNPARSSGYWRRHQGAMWATEVAQRRLGFLDIKN